MQNAVCKVLTCRYARKGMKEEMSLPPAWVMTTGMRRRADSTSPTTDTRPVSHTGEHMVTPARASHAQQGHGACHFT